MGKEVEEMAVPGINYKPVGIFWDIENCSVPKNKSASAVIAQIRNSFVFNRMNHREYEFLIAADVSRMRKDIPEDVNRAGGVTLAHVSGSSKNAADEKIRENMKRFVDTHNTTTPVLVLISGDIDFVNDLRGYQMRMGCIIVLVHAINCSQQFRMGWNEIYSFQDFCAAVPINPALEKQNAGKAGGENKQPKQGQGPAGPKQQQNQQKQQQGQNPEGQQKGPKPPKQGQQGTQNGQGSQQQQQGQKPPKQQQQQQGTQNGQGPQQQQQGQKPPKQQQQQQGQQNGAGPQGPKGQKNQQQQQGGNSGPQPQRQNSGGQPGQNQQQNAKGPKPQTQNNGPQGNNQPGENSKKKKCGQQQQQGPPIGQVLQDMEKVNIQAQGEQKPEKPKFILMVSGLPGKMDFHILKDHLQEQANQVFGKVKYVKNGQAFISFNRKENADRAVELFNGYQVYGKSLNVTFVQKIPFENPIDKQLKGATPPENFVMINHGDVPGQKKPKKNKPQGPPGPQGQGQGQNVVVGGPQHQQQQQPSPPAYWQEAMMTNPNMIGQLGTFAGAVIRECALKNSGPQTSGGRKGKNQGSPDKESCSIQ